MTTTQPVTTLIILGASGDLTSRLLLPGLGTLLKNQPEHQVRVLGAAYEPMPATQWADLVATSLTAEGVAPDVVQQVVAGTSYQELNVLDADQMSAFVAALPPAAVLYFALPPAITKRACELLATLPLPEDVLLALEKPFGTDLASAADFNHLLRSFIPEERIYRIDHFMGTTMLLNILGLRFANRVFEPLWNNHHIERVEITFDETLALEGRAGYYDSAGAMADMLQSHLLLVLAIVAMEEPAAVAALELRDLMVHVLRASELVDDPAAMRRARYTAGECVGGAVPAYLDEPGVDPERNTETLAELTVKINTSRWAGVPFVLRSGKALAQDQYHIRVLFKPVAHSIKGLANEATQNELVIRMCPDEVALSITTNGSGDKFALDASTMTAPLEESPVHAYGEILAGILRRDPLLSVRGDIAEQCWRIVTPAIAAWAKPEFPMASYPAGSSGPDSWTAAGVPQES